MATRLLYLVRHGEQENAAQESPTVGLSVRGRRQAELLADRLRGIPFTAVHHSPLARAAETAQILAGRFPGVPVHPSELVGDYPPSIPAGPELPAPYVPFVAQFDERERRDGPRLAAEAVTRFATPPDTDQRELVVTHNFLIAWFVRHALDAPDWRWLGLNHLNGSLTVIRYRADRPPMLLCHNDTGHLPPDLRSTGLSPELTF